MAERPQVESEGGDRIVKDGNPAAPDDTALRTALWRALHVQADPPPHVFADEPGRA